MFFLFFLFFFSFLFGPRVLASALARPLALLRVVSTSFLSLARLKVSQTRLLKSDPISAKSKSRGGEVIYKVIAECISIEDHDR